MLCTYVNSREELDKLCVAPAGSPDRSVSVFFIRKQQVNIFSVFLPSAVSQRLLAKPNPSCVTMMCDTSSNGSKSSTSSISNTGGVDGLGLGSNGSTGSNGSSTSSTGGMCVCMWASSIL